MFAKWCRCGASLPPDRYAKQIYCSPECRKQAQAERNGMGGTKKAQPQSVGAPGCGCGGCGECRLFEQYRRDSEIWHAADAKADRAS